MASEARGGDVMGSTAALRRFIRSYFEDQDSGQLRTLAEYQAGFPGHESVIAGGYRMLVADAGAGPSVEALAGGGAATSALLERGDALSSYRIVRELGRGGQGVVYLADDVRVQRQVAVKVLTARGGPGGADARRRFQREAEVAARLDHPGICPVYEVDIEAEPPYIVMPYLRGSSWAELVGPEGFDIRRSVGLAQQVALALHAAHEVGVIHRDVKPGNVIIVDDERAVLLDLGVASLDGVEQSTLTRTGALLGTMPYMSPEQLRGDFPLDGRTDVYSLGATLYECLTGHPPFEAATQERLYHEILERQPRDPREFNAGVSRDLRVVLDTALAKERERRYQSADEFAEELARVAAGRAIAARPPSTVERFGRWYRLNPKLASAVSCAFVLLVVGLAATLLLLDEVRAEKRAKEHTLAGKQAALEEVGRLSDLKRVRDLQAEEQRLWPVRAERAADMDAWLGRADELLARLPEHRATLTGLGAHLERSTSEPSIGVLTAGAETVATAGAPTAVPGAGPGPAPGSTPASMPASVGQLDATSLAWQVESLTALVQQLEALPTLVAAVRERVEVARIIDDATVAAHAAGWNQCRRVLADEDRYAGVELEPVVGLVPLGPDPVSGLLEFGHPESGALPVRDGSSGELVQDVDTSLVFVLLPGGSCAVGAEAPSAARPAESAHTDPYPGVVAAPVHSVQLQPFLMSKHELTQSQWLRLAGENPSLIQDGPQLRDAGLTLRHPVEQVTWNDATAVLDRYLLALPTESQWEYACRAGTSGVWHTGSQPDSLFGWENLADEVARGGRARWADFMEGMHDGFPYHAPVGSFRPNPFGLHDLHGNVAEWCRDLFGSYDWPAAPGDALRTPPNGTSRVLRGGSFNDIANNTTAAYRHNMPADASQPTVGVRPIFVTGARE